MIILIWKFLDRFKSVYCKFILCYKYLCSPDWISILISMYDIKEKI